MRLFISAIITLTFCLTPFMAAADGLTTTISEMGTPSIIKSLDGLSRDQKNSLINDNLTTSQCAEVFGELDKDLKNDFVDRMSEKRVKEMVDELSGESLQKFIGYVSSSIFRKILPDLPVVKLVDITEGSTKENRKIIVNALNDETLGELIVAVEKTTRTQLIELLRQKCGSSSSSSSSSSSTTTVKKKKKSPCGDTGTCHEPQIPTDVP